MRGGGGGLGNWKLGVGVSSMLKPTSDPQPGDIGYLNDHQHHFIVASVDGDSIVGINGNSTNGAITEGTRSRRNVTAFYRIPI